MTSIFVTAVTIPLRSYLKFLEFRNKKHLNLIVEG